MERILIWLIISVVVCVILRRRPLIVLCTAIGLRLFFPSVAGGVIVGASGVLHPASWFLLVAAVVLLANHARALAVEFSRSFGLYVLLLLLLTQAIIVTRVLSPQGLMPFVNTYVTAIVLFFLLRAFCRGNEQSTHRVMRFVVVFAAAESAFALVQVATGSAILFAAERTAFYWERGLPLTRAYGTLDSPIDLAMLCALAIPLTIALRSGFLRVALPVLILAGALATQSRVGVIAAAVAILYAIARAHMTFGKKFLSALALPVAIGVLAWANPTVADGFFTRLSTDTVSLAARDQSLGLFLDQVIGRGWTGSGFGSSYAIRSQGLSEASLENGFFMYIWDFGLFFGVLFAVTIFGLLVVGATSGAVRGTVAAAAVAAVMAAAFSGISTQSAASWLLLLAVGLAASGMPERTRSYCSSYRRAERRVSIDA